MGLNELIKAAAKKLRKFDRVHIISHYDCDGICAAAIAYSGLKTIGIDSNVEFVREINENEIEKIKRFENKNLLFTDIGSGQLTFLEKLSEFNIVISDHHKPETDKIPENIFQLNPHLAGIDGGKMISGAGITYFLMRELNVKNNYLGYLALVGATGDIQKDDEFFGLNKDILKECINLNLIQVRKGLTLFGRNNRAIPLALAYTTEPYLPGLSNNESSAVQFLTELDISLKDNGNWRTLKDLTIEEEKKIIHGLITHNYDVGSLVGNLYLLKNGWEISEFSSLLNACGRLEKAEIGLKICLGDDTSLAADIQREYGRKISSYMNLIENGNLEIIKKDNCFILNAKNKIHENLIGTMTSIYSRNNKADFMIGMAYGEDNSIKVSARSSNSGVEKGLLANKLLEEICSKCGGQGGGHELAAGGKIPMEQEDTFIKLLQDVLFTSKNK